MEFIDTHAHLYLEQFANDVDEVLARAKGEGVSRIILPNIDKASMPALLALTERHPDLCIPLPGLHPTHVTTDYEEEVQAVSDALASQRYMGVGEIGIDLYWDKTYFKEQQNVFEMQLGMALDHNLPVVIHARESFDEIFEIVSQTKYSRLTGVFHAFTGTLPQAEKIVSLGFFLGIGGVVTFKNSQLSEVVRQVDLKHLVLETDAPYLAPVPHRGKRNESAYIRIIAEHVAGIKKLSIVQVAKVTTSNAKEVFKLQTI